MDTEEFGVFISHGGKSHVWKDIMIHLQNKYDIGIYELSHQKSKGLTVIEKLNRVICEDCDYAIVIMTKEDETKDGKMQARPNVMHELGYCQGVLGRHNVLLLCEKGVEIFSNISGIVREEFDGENIKSAFSVIDEHLEEAHERWEDDEMEYGECE